MKYITIIPAIAIILTILASCFAHEPQVIGQVSIPQDEIVITFVAE